MYVLSSFDPHIDVIAQLILCQLGVVSCCMQHLLDLFIYCEQSVLLLAFNPPIIMRVTNQSLLPSNLYTDLLQWEYTICDKIDFALNYWLLALAVDFSRLCQCCTGISQQIYTLQHCHSVRFSVQNRQKGNISQLSFIYLKFQQLTYFLHWYFSWQYQKLHTRYVDFSFFHTVLLFEQGVLLLLGLS